MLHAPKITRREFIQNSSALLATTALPLPHDPAPAPLTEFNYADVNLSSPLHESQRLQTQSILLGLSEDDLLKPFRTMSGLPAPGNGLGGWYDYLATYDYRTGEAGLAPGATFGQWISALARNYAITKAPATREKILRLNRLYAETISGKYYELNRFPAYCYDKLVCGLIDSHQFANDPQAFNILDRTTEAALPHLPPHAIDREINWRPGKDKSFDWDESYTLPENLFLAAQRGAGDRYRRLALQYLDDETYFDPLARNQDVLAGKQAYSYVNALSSAMQAWFIAGSQKHLRAAINAFSMLQQQSYATGGWGADEQLRASGADALFPTLTKSHNHFETPCGSYAHMKLTRYLLRATRDSRYGDSMERIIYNSVLGAKPLRPDGTAFYNSDYNFNARKIYSVHKWPCCSGTLPQAAADYRINTFFRDRQGIYVNLYLASTLHCQQDGADITLTQETSYPHDSHIALQVTASRPAHFTLHLRIPQWASSAPPASAASLRINGKRVPARPGTFATITRTWKSGDHIELDLPLTPRLEPISPQHPDTVALLSGPLVLFPITTAQPPITRAQLLAARQLQSQMWQIETAAGPITLLPFTAIQDQTYTAYIDLTQ